MEEEIVNNRERDLADELLAACVLFCLWPPVSLQRRLVTIMGGAWPDAAFSRPAYGRQPHQDLFLPLAPTPIRIKVREKERLRQ